MSLSSSEPAVGAVSRRIVTSGDPYFDNRTPEELFDINKFYLTRSETIRTRLWTTLTWLAAVQGGALVFTVEKGGLRTAQEPIILLEQPIMITLLAALSCVFALYMAFVAGSGLKHIDRNFKRANQSLRMLSCLPPKTPEFARNDLAIRFMRAVAVVAFVIELLLVGIGLLGICEWLFGVDISWIQIPKLSGAAA
jgi:hypothetical protein